MSADFAELLARKTPVLADGAWGTELARRARQRYELPDALNLVEPAVVRAVAAEYLAAGAEIILTNTFGANPWRLAAAGLADRLEELNRAGARLSREAVAQAGRPARVAGSIGPSGKMLLTGEVTPEALSAGFRAQAAALAAGGAEALVLETFSDLDELQLALAAARAATPLPVVACFSFDSGAPEEPATMMGLTPAAAAEALGALPPEARPAALGANCGRGPEGYLVVARQLRAAWTGPLWLKPNAGLPEVVGGQTVYRTPPAEFAAAAARLAAAGANIIGGCCGTTPAHIRELAGVLRRGQA